MKFSLVIPCYNEAKNLPLLLDRCVKVAAVDSVEVILVDNGSSDDSAEILKKLLPNYPGCRSVRVEKNQGYGFGILSGLNAATGDVLGWTHADMQTDPYDFIRGLDFFAQDSGPLFVKGSRYGRPIADVLFTVGMSIFETMLLRTRLWDINAQPTMFRRDSYLQWKDAPYDFSLDLYAYYSAKRHSCSVKRFPVLFGQRAHGVSHWNISWSAKWKFIRRTVEFSLRLRKQIVD